MVCCVGIYGQDLSESNYFLKAFRINSGIGYDRYDDVGYYNFNELTWLSQVSVTLTRGLYVGIVVNSIYTMQTGMPNENYFLKGAFVQYDLTKKRKMMTFLELSYMQGDYCTCMSNAPFRKIGLQYIGFGAGFEYPILNSSFYGSASFILHRILGDVEEKHNYNIPTLGLSYRFGKPKY